MYLFAVTLCSGLWNIHHLVLQKVITLHCNSFIMAVASLISQVWAMLNGFHKGQQQYSASLLLLFATMRWDVGWILAEKTPHIFVLRSVAYKNLRSQWPHFLFCLWHQVVSHKGQRITTTQPLHWINLSYHPWRIFASTSSFSLILKHVSYLTMTWTKVTSRSLKGGLAEQPINTQYK